jgi:hypothetical protein
MPEENRDGVTRLETRRPVVLEVVWLRFACGTLIRVVWLSTCKCIASFSAEQLACTDMQLA